MCILVSRSKKKRKYIIREWSLIIVTSKNSLTYGVNIFRSYLKVVISCRHQNQLTIIPASKEIHTLISFYNILLCLYYCMFRVTFSKSHSCPCKGKNGSICIGGTWYFVKSITYFRPYTLRHPTNAWPLNLSSKS